MLASKLKGCLRVSSACWPVIVLLACEILLCSPHPEPSAILPEHGLKAESRPAFHIGGFFAMHVRGGSPRPFTRSQARAKGASTPDPGSSLTESKQTQPTRQRLSRIMEKQRTNLVQDDALFPESNDALPSEELADKTPKRARVSFRDLTASGRRIAETTPAGEVFTYTPESIVRRGQRSVEPDQTSLDSPMWTPTRRRKREKKVILTPLGRSVVEGESYSASGGASEDGWSRDSVLHSEDSVASRTRSRTLTRASDSEMVSASEGGGYSETGSRSEVEPSSQLEDRESSARPGGQDSSAMEETSDQAVSHTTDTPAPRRPSRPRRSRPTRRPRTGEAVVYEGGWLVPHKTEWEAPCDLVGCDGKQCKAWARKQQRDAKFAVGDRVRSQDGAGSVVGKDSSSRPLRVRLDATGEEAWYRLGEVRKTSVRQRDDTLLSASAFGLSARTLRAMSQSGTTDISASPSRHGADTIRTETVPEYAASSLAKAERAAYGPHADSMHKPQSLRELERELGIEQLQIRIWPMIIRSTNATENAELQRRCWYDPSIVLPSDTDKTEGEREYGAGDSSASEDRSLPCLDDQPEVPLVLKSAAKYLVVNRELTVRTLEQDIMAALDVSAETARAAAKIFRRFVRASKALRLSNVHQLVASVLRKADASRQHELWQAKICDEICTRLPQWVQIPDEPIPENASKAQQTNAESTDVDFDSSNVIVEESGRRNRLTTKQVRRQLFHDDASESGDQKSAGREPYTPRPASYNGTYSKIGSMPGTGEPILLRDDWTTAQGEPSIWDRDPKNISVHEIVDYLSAVVGSESASDVDADGEVVEDGGEMEEESDPPFFTMTLEDILLNRNASSAKESRVDSKGDSCASTADQVGGQHSTKRRAEAESRSAKRQKTTGKSQKRSAGFDFAKAFGGVRGQSNTEETPAMQIEVPSEAGLAPSRGLVLVGGFDGRDYLSSVDVYDVAADRWTPRVAALQEMQWGGAESQAGSKRGFLASVSFMKRVYCIGGFDPNLGGLRCDVVESFDMRKWSRRREPSMLEPRSWHAAAISDGSILVVGGNNGTHHTNKRYAPAACALDGRVIAAGGFGGKVGSPMQAMDTLKTVESYDFKQDTWSSLPPLPYPVSRFGMAAARGRVYAVGGFNGEYALDSVVSFDPRMRIWKAEPTLCVRRSYASIVVAGDCIYALGGYNGALFSDTVEMWDTRSGGWTPCSKMQSARAYMGAASL